MEAHALKGSRCLVTGGAGNLGGHIVRLLVDELEAATVVSFDLVAHPLSSVVSVVGDVTDQAALEAAMEGVTHVFHTASIIDIRPLPSPRQHHVNVHGTFAVIQACKAVGVKLFHQLLIHFRRWP